MYLEGWEPDGDQGIEVKIERKVVRDIVSKRYRKTCGFVCAAVAIKACHCLISSPSLSPLSLQRGRLWWASAPWWRSPTPSPWPRSWRGCASLSTSPWSSSQRRSFSTSLWTSGPYATASSPSTPKVHMNVRMGTQDIHSCYTHTV